MLSDVLTCCCCCCVCLLLLLLLMCALQNARQLAEHCLKLLLISSLT
jgi:hypothetical protein